MLMSKGEYTAGRPSKYGGFGEIRVARRREGGTRVALKETTSSASSISSEELTKLYRIEHPNIVRFLGTFEEPLENGDNLKHYLVIEYCEGGDMAQLIEAATTPLAESFIQRWSRQLVAAVKYLHEKEGLVHCDIRPQNIFLTSDQQTVKLSHFRVSEVIGDASEDNTMKTWPYTAPEYFRGQPYVKSNDIWSLGVTIYELANFKKPFEGEGGSVIQEIILQQPAPFDTTRGYSTEMRDFVMEMLVKTLEKRPTIQLLSRNNFVSQHIDSDVFSYPPDSPPASAAAELPKSFERIQNCPCIASHQKTEICSILNAECMTPDQLLEEVDDKSIKLLFPKKGLQLAVLKWQEIEREKKLQKEVEDLERRLELEEQKLDEEKKNLTELQSRLSSKQQRLDEERNKLATSRLNLQRQDMMSLFQNSRLSEKQKSLIRNVLEDEVMTPEQLLTADDELLRTVFEKAGLRDAVQKWRQQLLNNKEHQEMLTTTVSQYHQNWQAITLTHTAQQSYTVKHGQGEARTEILERRKEQQESKNVELFDKTRAVEMVLSYAGQMHSLAKSGDVGKMKALLFEEIQSKLLPPLAIHSYLWHLVEHRNDSTNLTPLLEAASLGNLGMVRFLVEELHANVYVQGGHVDAVQLMAIHYAANNGFIEVVKYMLQKQSDLLRAKGSNNDTPLHRAVSGGHLDIVEFLIKEKDADVEARGELSRTPLLIAAMQDHLPIVRLLIETRHAAIDARDSFLESMAIHLAATFGHINVVRYLLEKDSGLINAGNKNNERALYRAAQNGHLNIVEFLVEKRADVEARSMNDKTALFAAAEKGHVPVVKYLMEHANAKPSNGTVTVLQVAAHFKQVEVARYLLQHYPGLITTAANDAAPS